MTSAQQKVQIACRAGTSGDAKLHAPKLFGIDIAALESNVASNDALPKLLLMRGDENLTEWDVAVSRCRHIMHHCGSYNEKVCCAHLRVIQLPKLAVSLQIAQAVALMSLPMGAMHANVPGRQLHVLPHCHLQVPAGKLRGCRSLSYT